MSPTLHGTWRLVRLIIRRDRVRLALWLGILGGVMVASAASLPPLYPDQRSIDEYARLFSGNPALVAFAGPGYGFDDPNLGVILVNELQLWGMIGFALMAVFLLIRHTRAEEDVERAEVIRSSVVGRHAPTTAAVIVVGSTILVLAAALGLGFVALGYGTVGSLALVGSYALVGWVFCGIATVAAQVAGTGRGAIGIGVSALVITFLTRALGDIGDNALRWTSPLGWGQSVRAFAGERWWTLAFGFVVGTALVVLGFWLSTRRDLGSGLLPARLGPAGSTSLGRPVDLAVRMQRGAVAAWAVGIFLVGVVYASIAEDIEDMIRDNPTFADVIAQLQGATITDSFFATAVVMIAAISSGYTISAVLRLRTEESAGRLEPLVTTSVSRWRWAASHLAVIVAGTAAILVAAGLGLGLSYAVVIGDASQIARLTGAVLVSLPAVLLLGSIGVALFGWWPRGVLAAWVSLGVVVILDFLGELLRLPEPVRQLSPFRWLPAVPAEPMQWSPLIVVGVLASAITAVGLVGFRRRDLVTE